MRKPKKYDLKAWNEKYPIGSPCVLTDDFGKQIETKTTSKAWELGHGQAVVCIECKSGGWEFERIRMV